MSNITGAGWIRGTSESDNLYGSYANDLMYGYGGDDYFWQSSRADYMDGGSGNDTLCGAGGHDTLVGGSGSDLFSFEISTSSDSAILQDYNYSEDKLRIITNKHDSEFGSTLDANEFAYYGSYLAHDTSHIVYNPYSGSLYYVPKGMQSWSTDIVEIAKLQPYLFSLTGSSFELHA